MKKNVLLKVNCIIILTIISCHFVHAQIAFSPPSIPMWDTWIYQNDDDYHLFYLSNGNIGRAVSTDMIHWRTMPTIMNMANKGDWDERGARMTGCTVKQSDTYYITYGSAQDGPGTNVGLLVSKDLKNWERYKDNPIVSPKPPYEDNTRHFRDLVSFYDSDKKIWDGYMFGIHKKTGRPSIAHLTSKNYKKWELQEPIFISEDYSRINNGFIYLEVPDYFQIGDKHYFVFSSVRSRKEFTSGRKDASGTWYIVADKKEGPYKVPDEPLLLGYGNGRTDTYVGHTVSYKGKRLLYHHTWGDWGKVSLATPKLLHQNSDGTLELHFWKDLKKLEKKVLYKQAEIKCEVKKADSRKWEIIDGVTGIDIAITGKVKTNDSSRAGITWHISGEKAQGICFYPNEDRITIGEIEHITGLNANTIKNNFFDDYREKGLLNGEFNLRIMVRGYMVELYINDQLIFATSMLNTPEQGGVGYWSDEGNLLIGDLKVSELESLK